MKPMGMDWIAGRLWPYHFRGKCRILNSLTPKVGIRIAKVFGFEMELGSKDPDAATAAVVRIGSTLRDVLARAGHDGTTPLAAALAVAGDRVAAAV